MSYDFVAGASILLTVLGGMLLIGYALAGRQRMRELVMRERIALIERGLAPAPEVDPARFDALVRPPAEPPHMVVKMRPAGRGTRYRSAGVLIMGFGAALFLLLTFTTGLPELAFGIGGGFAILGAALFVNGIMVGNDPEPDWRSFTRIDPRPPYPPSGQ